MICRRKFRHRHRSEPRRETNPEIRQLPEFLDFGRYNEIPTFWTCRPGSARCQQVLSTNTITISYTASITSTTTCLPFLGFLFCYKRKINFFIPTSLNLFNSCYQWAVGALSCGFRAQKILTESFRACPTITVSLCESRTSSVPL